MFMTREHGIVTCHVAVNLQRPQWPTAIGIYPVVIRRLAEVFVRFAGRLVDSWKETSSVSTAQTNGSPDKCPGGISNTGNLLRSAVSC